MIREMLIYLILLMIFHETNFRFFIVKGIHVIVIPNDVRFICLSLMFLEISQIMGSPLITMEVCVMFPFILNFLWSCTSQKQSRGTQQYGFVSCHIDFVSLTIVYWVSFMILHIWIKSWINLFLSMHNLIGCIWVQSWSFYSLGWVSGTRTTCVVGLI